MNKYSVSVELAILVQEAFPDASDLNEISDVLLPYLQKAIDSESLMPRDCPRTEEAYERANRWVESTRNEHLRDAAERDELDKECRKMEVMIQRLRAALEPFAKEAPKWDIYEDGEQLVESFPQVDTKITVGDLRRALSALAPASSGKGEG